MVKKIKFTLIQYKYQVLIFLILSLIFTLPLILTGENLGIQDWDHQLAFLESARKTMLDYHQLPLWNPYHCGGMAGIGHPQSNIISITFLFVLFFGTVIGVKISIFFHYWLLAFGMYFFARYFKISKIGSLIASIITTFGGVLSSALGAGMLPFLSFSYVPITLYLYLNTLNLRKIHFKKIFLTGLLLAINFYSGYHILLIFSVFLLIFPFYFLIKQKNFYPLLNAFLIFVMFLILSFPKLILSIKLMLLYPRVIEDRSGYSLINLLYFLLSKIQNYHGAMFIKDFNYNTDENSLYIGIIPFIFFIYGLVKGFKKNKILVFGLFISFLLILGYYSPFNLFALLKKVYFFNFFRVAQRFRFIFILFLSLFVGIGMDYLIENFKIKKRLAFFLSGLIYIDLFIFSYINFFSKTFIIKNPASKIFKENLSHNFKTVSNLNIEYHSQKKKDKPMLNLYYGGLPQYLPWSNEFLAVKKNLGIINCYESIPIDKNVVGEDQNKYRGEIYTLHKREVKIDYWSPNKIIITVQPNIGKDILVINQNYFPGWWVTIDGATKKAINYHNLIATEVNQKKQTIIFFYNPYKDIFSLK